MGRRVFQRERLKFPSDQLKLKQRERPLKTATLKRYTIHTKNVMDKVSSNNSLNKSRKGKMLQTIGVDLQWSCFLNGQLCFRVSDTKDLLKKNFFLKIAFLGQRSQPAPL